ncbi:MAG: CHAT domain-containing protein, partial [Deltaproteobacteria bacterium]|nr:CHAT domain-containing protein [Deltaproteobacteria bacterium]
EPHLVAAIKIVPDAAAAMQMLATIRVKQKRLEDSAELTQRVLAQQPGGANSIYNWACNLSLRGQTDAALDALEKAFQNGYSSFDSLKSDTDLDNLRKLPRYAELVSKYSGGAATASTSGSPARSDELRAQADTLRKADKCAEAGPIYVRAIAEERATPQPRESKIRKDLLWLGFCDKDQDKLEDARKHFEEAIAISEHIGGNFDDVGVFSRTLLGGVYEKLEMYDKAVATLEASLPALHDRGDDDMVAVGKYNIAKAYREWGRYDRALSTVKEARKINDGLLAAKPNDPDITGRILANIELECDLLNGWGQNAQALEAAQKGLALAKASNGPKNVVDMYMLLGRLNLTSSKADAAEAAYRQAIALSDGGKFPKTLPIAQNGLAQALVRAGKLQEALDTSVQALATSRKTNVGLHASLVSTAQIMRKAGQKEQALGLLQEELALRRKSGSEDDIARAAAFVADALPDDKRAEQVKLYEEALAIHTRRGNLPGQSAILRDLGITLLNLERYPEAVRHLSNAVQILEQLRKTASGEARRDYLAQSLGAYEVLILAHLRNSDTPSAFRTMELSRAKLLAERIAGAGDVSIPAIGELPRLAGEGSILLYSNVDLDQPVHFVVNSSGMQAWPRPLPESLKVALTKLPQVVKEREERDRGMHMKGAPVRKEERSTELEAAVETYRRLLISPAPESQATAKELGKLLYEALIVPSLKYLKPGKPLLIAPDGVLAFLPFETLVDPQGKYLAETYDIHYVQSLSVLQALQARTYPANRKPLLAFGGAVYDKSTYAKDMMQAREAEMFAMADQIHERLATRGSMRDAYSALGVSWGNLPGTLKEVNALPAIVPGAEIVTGDKVSEETVNKLSQSGALANYKVLHFATHGLVVPQLPELSALVLSQTGAAAGAASGADDGYLHMGEIAALQLKADFVNLSACETGLGKIYGGEGVVGLTQAFLIAGANGLSVSLWQVADESTSKFMQEVYRLHQSGTPFPSAIAEVKRRFVAGKYGNAWRDPHYWAPFVYYGQ